MAESLGETGITKRFAETLRVLPSAGNGGGIAVLLLVYFYAHYGFASITLIQQRCTHVSGVILLLARRHTLRCCR